MTLYNQHNVALLQYYYSCFIYHELCKLESHNRAARRIITIGFREAPQQTETVKTVKTVQRRL